MAPVEADMRKTCDQAFAWTNMLRAARAGWFPANIDRSKQIYADVGSIVNDPPHLHGTLIREKDVIAGRNGDPLGGDKGHCQRVSCQEPRRVRGTILAGDRHDEAA